jgi:hypothetical protein
LVYGIYLSLDQDRWFRNDFSSDDKLTGTIYTDINQTSAKNLTGYTVTIRMSKTDGFGKFTDRFNKAADIEVAANGTWSYAVAEGEIPVFGLYNVWAEISKSGTNETTLNHTTLHIIEGPSE